MAFNINLFTGAMKLGGARPSHFQVNITNPINGASDIQAPFMVKGASLPGSTLTPIEVRYFGRAVKFAGTRTFNDWTTTILNDEDFAIRNSLEQWHNAINGAESNLRELSTASPILYKADLQVTQFAKTGVPLRIYNIRNAFPTDISPIDLSWENGDVIEEYTVTWSYEYHEVTGGITGTAGA